MKSLDCDQVFDILTRGPFPTGESSDYLVEEHLACCYECRQLAEALRPAVELFHEAILPEEARDLPGYQGVYAGQTGGLGLAQLVAQAIEPQAPPVHAHPVTASRHAWNVWLSSWRLQLGTALAVGMLLAFTLWGEPAPTLPLLSRGLMTRNIDFRPSHESYTTLASLPLSASCQFPASPLVENAAWHCCTQCHSSERGPAISSAMLANIATSCQACHH